MLWDYFSIGILETEDGPVLSSIPCVFRHPTPYIPSMAKIPQLIVDLSGVDYSDEEKCFSGVARCLADFFVPVEFSKHGDYDEQMEAALEAEELAETDYKKKERILAMKDNMMHIIFPRLKNQFLPPKSLLSSVSRVISMRDACKLFGRCGGVSG